MKFEQSPNSRPETVIKKDKERSNYLEHAKSAASRDFLGRGITPAEIVIGDSKREDRYRKYLNEGKISESEFRLLTRYDLKILQSNSLDSVGRAQDVITGIADGKLVKAFISEIKSDAKYQKGEVIDFHDTKRDIKYQIFIDGEEVAKGKQEEQMRYFNDLYSIMMRKEKVLEKVEILDIKDWANEK